MSNYKAIILAAGQGTRLRPLTNNIPKCMVEVGGKPMLHRQLDAMERVGIDEIIVVAGYRENKITDSRITKIINVEYDSTNMIYSLFCARSFLEGDVIISYGDIIYSDQVLKQVMSADGDIVIASDEKWQNYWEERCENPLSDAETFVKGEGNTVKSLGQKATSMEEIEGQFIGLTKLSSAGCARLKSCYNECLQASSCIKNAWGSGREIRNAYMTDILNHFAMNDKLYFTSIQRGWFEVDTPSDYSHANANFSDEIL